MNQLNKMDYYGRVCTFDLSVTIIIVFTDTLRVVIVLVGVRMLMYMCVPWANVLFS